METDVSSKLKEFFYTQKLLTYKKGEMIVRAEDEPSGVYFLEEGYVRLGTQMINGTELTFNIFKPGSFFPMMWALAEAKNSYFCQAITPVKVYRAPKLEVIKMLKENPDILLDLTKRVLTGMDGLLSNIQFLLFGSSYNRVASSLLILSKRFGLNSSPGEILINIDLTHQDIASVAGVTRETTSIMLKQLEKAGILGRKKKKFIIKTQKLEEEVFISESDNKTPLTI